MHSFVQSKNFLLSIILILFSTSSIMPMEVNNGFEFFKTYNSLKSSYKKTKDFLYDCNHKIATAGIITFSVGCGCGGGFLAFLLLKSYAAAALLGTLTSPVAYGFQKLSKKIDELRKTIEENHEEIKALMVQGDQKVIGELKEHFTHQLELALDEIKKTTEISQDQTRKTLEQNIALALNAIKTDTEKQFAEFKKDIDKGLDSLKLDFKLADVETKTSLKLISSNLQMLKKEIDEDKEAKELAISSEKEQLLGEITLIASQYYQCSYAEAEEYIAEQKGKKISQMNNKQLLRFQSQLNYEFLQKQQDGLLKLTLENGQEITLLKQEVKETKGILDNVMSRLDTIEQGQKSQKKQLDSLENFASNQSVHTAELRKGVSQILTIVDTSKKYATSTDEQQKNQVFHGLPNQFLTKPFAYSSTNLQQAALPYKK
ncbi:MAG: hypothetical protein ACOYT8_00370 [Candidatus Dependentiae bacterium]